MADLLPCTEQTFTPASVVPQGADGAVVYSSGTLDSFGTDDTPIDWPNIGTIKAIEVELTSTTPDFTQDGQVQVGLTVPNDLAPLPGATSDASGSFSGWTGFVRRYRTGDSDIFYLNKFGGWRTDYLSPSVSAGTANVISTGDAAPLRVAGIDLRARVRCADWNESTGDRRTIAARYTGGGNGSWIWGLNINNVQLVLNRSGGGNFEYTVSCAQSTLGLVDGEWADLRVTYDNTNRVRWYDVNGALVQTDNVTGMTDIEAGTAGLRLGNNYNAGGRSAGGLKGDIASFEMYDSSGTLLQTLTLDAMDASNDTAWTSAVGGGWFRGSSVGVTGATIPATKRVRIDLDTPCPVEDFRLIVDAQTGALTVDEILLIADCQRGRRGLGLIR